jgi:glycosidase
MFKPTALGALCALALVSPLDAQMMRPGYNHDVIYQVFVDRFFDGSVANNIASDPLYDASGTNLQKYQGGDFQGLTQKMPYLANMGISAIWITSPLDNRNVIALAGSTAPYHGYEMRDSERPDEHFTNAAQSWQPFTDFVNAAHAVGIKVIVDFAPNHSNVRNSGEDGRIARNGVLEATYASNPGGYFQTGPNMGGAQWDSPYETQYYTIYDLADLNQHNPNVDSMLKAAVANLQARGVDGFRLDATKHVNWGWQYSLANSIYSNRTSFVFGEWVADDRNNPLYPDLLKFSNQSGVAELNFPLFTTLSSVFGQGGSFVGLNQVISEQQTDFAFQNDLVNFVDNHDRKRFLTIDTSTHDRRHLEQALAFVLTTRGIPCVYYGSEQYLEGGDDPDNRRKMPAFSETTTAYRVIQSLSGLRRDNEALAYGSTTERWLSANTYVYERKFFGSVVVVAINKSDSAQAVGGLLTSLPTGSYPDRLNGLLDGVSLSSTTTNGALWNSNGPTLPARSVSVWQLDPTVSAAQLGNLSPTAGQPGLKVMVSGQGFGSAAGTVKFGSASAAITSWTDRQIVATVPSGVSGVQPVSVTRSGSSTASNTFNFGVHPAKLIPVTFTVNNAAPTNPGDAIYLTGNTLSLSNWASTKQAAVGAMLTTPTTYPNWWLTVSVPAGTTLQFKAIRIRANGTVTWESGANHSYTVPASGVGNVSFNWQY